jgi:hypothetical protein
LVRANRQEDDAVTFRSRCLLTAALGAWIAGALPAQEPARLGVEPGKALQAAEISPNQQIADTIAEHLSQSGHLRGYTVDVLFQDGTAELSGTVADEPQRDEVLRIAQGVPGVERVRDRLTLASAAILQAQAPLPPPTPEPGPLTAKPGEATPPGVRTTEPLPLIQGMPTSPYDLNPPRMPPYAWPTYAPYNNYARVAYPEAYPYQAWPFIGPPYPFPKIPPGWRRVELRWQDGHWWFSKLATKHDWWRVRYW